MRIVIKSLVEQDYRSVFQGFDEELFKALAPRLMPVQVVRFDGCREGDEVHLKVGPGPLAQNWEAKVIEFREGPEEIYFVDTGQRLPFPLRRWRHRHRMIKQGQQTLIVDDIQFRSLSILLDPLVYPFLWALFRIRKPVYQRWFGKVRASS